jgi:hypothetical protein
MLVVADASAVVSFREPLNTPPTSCSRARDARYPVPSLADKPVMKLPISTSAPQSFGRIRAEAAAGDGDDVGA